MEPPEDTFNSNTLLQTIDFSNCGLTRLPYLLFDKTTALQTLRLSGNLLTLLPRGIFGKLTSLASLDLSQNSFGNPCRLGQFSRLLGQDYCTLPAGCQGVGQTLSTCSPASHYGLTTLDLSSSNIGEVDPSAFTRLYDVRNISLANNAYLEVLPQPLFVGLNLTSLDLHGTALNILPNGLLAHLGSLQHLRLGPHFTFPCPRGFKESRLGQDYCSMCHTELSCSSPPEYLRACNATHDASCERCRNCATGSGTWLSKVCTGTEDSVCSPCSVCGGETYTEKECVNDRDTVCAPCSTCTGNQILVSRCSPQKNTVCRACSVCGAGTYETAPCGDGVDTQCTACTECGAHEYAVVACGGGDGGRDTQCEACKVCGAGQYVSTDCTGTADTVCSDCEPTCAANSATPCEVIGCSSLSNRLCWKCPEAVPQGAASVVANVVLEDVALNRLNSDLLQDLTNAAAQAVSVQPDWVTLLSIQLQSTGGTGGTGGSQRRRLWLPLPRLALRRRLLGSTIEVSFVITVPPDAIEVQQCRRRCGAMGDTHSSLFVVCAHRPLLALIAASRMHWHYWKSWWKAA